MRETEQEIKRELTLEDVPTLPQILVWRNAYLSFGANPNKFRNSAEALLRRVLNGKELPAINSLVDIYNTISIKYKVPLGGDDLDKVDGDILLTKAKGTESFTSLGSTETEIVEPGEVIYQDAKEVLCRRWNWRESNKSCMTEHTKNVCFVIEVLDSTTNLSQVLQELGQDIHTHCGGHVTTYTIDKDNKEIEL